MIDVRVNGRWLTNWLAFSFLEIEVITASFQITWIALVLRDASKMVGKYGDISFFTFATLDKRPSELRVKNLLKF